MCICKKSLIDYSKKRIDYSHTKEEQTHQPAKKLEAYHPAFMAVDVRTLNVQLEIFKVLMKDGEFTCFDDILAKIKQLSEAEKCMITEIITLCKLLLVNPATSAAGERSFSSARRLKTWLRSTMTQARFSNLTILNTHKQRTDKVCLIEVPNEFAALNEIEKATLAPSKNLT